MNNHDRIEFHLDRLLASGEAVVHFEDIITRKDVIKNMCYGDSFMVKARELITDAVTEYYKDEE